MMQKLFPSVKHLLLAGAIFLITALFFFYPEFQGKTLFQSDIEQWESMRQEMKVFEKQTGKVPFWTNSMFGGMPSTLIWQDPGSNPFVFISYIYNFLGRSTWLMVITMLCFYVFASLFTRHFWLRILGAISLGLSTFTVASIEAGHASKVSAFAYLPLLYAGFYLCIKNKYILGFAVSALAAYFAILSNHVQITYYGIIAFIFIGLYEIVHAIKNKETANISKAILIFITASILGILANSKQLYTTLQYQKQSNRNGSSLAQKKDTKSGLDKDYAFSWSYGLYENLTLISPGIIGYSSNEKLSDKSNVYQAISEQAGEEQAAAFINSAPTYWGDLPFTGGPIYFGAVVFLLFVMSMFVYKPAKKWAIFAGFLVCLIIGMGKNLSFINYFLFDTLPFFNKFRTVLMANMVGNIFVLWIIILGLNELVNLVEDNKKEELIKLLKRTSIVVASVFVVLFVLSYSFNFQALSDKQLEQYDWLVSALRKDRAAMMQASIFKSLMFALLALAALYLYVTDKLKLKAVLPILFLLSFIDLAIVGKRYLTADKFVEKEDLEAQHIPTAIDNEILKDKSLFYRVHNVTVDPFNSASTSYFHKTVGGYNPAKLSIYQDLIEHQISKGNQAVFNMLNTKYFIVNDQQTKQPKLIQNPDALGNAWFVNEVDYAQNPKEEMEKLSNLSPDKKVIVANNVKANLNTILNTDTSASISLMEYLPDFTKYKFNSQTPQNVVFSEIYYPREQGMTCKIDGKEVDFAKANYVLRAVQVPSGSHTIEWSFKPKMYDELNLISNVSRWLILVLFLLAISIFIKNQVSV